MGRTRFTEENLRAPHRGAGVESRGIETLAAASCEPHGKGRGVPGCRVGVEANGGSSENRCC